MRYQDLDIHGRINLKDTYQRFLEIAVERFQASQNKRIYNVARRGTAKKRPPRTKNLYNSFSTKMLLMGVNDQLQIEFLMYGRYLDMGVGRGANAAQAKLKRRYRAHRQETPRKPRRWFSKTKAREHRKLSEILAKRYGIAYVQMVESTLSQTVTL